ncbi:MAG: DNA polymerase III subunit alpha, partial [Candidatus Brocadiia bacterium]
VIRDVGRVMEIQQGYIDRLAKMIPGGPNVDLAQSMKDSPELRKEYEQNDQTRNLLDVALRLEGLSRNASVHAAAVVIADKPLTEYLPLSRAKKDAGEEQQTVTQYSKDYVEKIGLLKMDFLGLQTLTMVEYAQRIIEESTGHRVEFDDKFDDKATYDFLCTGHTMGVFQLESRGMRELVKRLKPDCFEDIIANIALFRPGPLGGGMLDSFVNGKHGREKIEYLHPSLEGVLKNTYGMILYQEQAMRIANVIGNFTLAEADSLRKAMAKKKPEMMEKYRKQFVENAPKNGVDAATAEVIFKKIEEFAGYGFNKSHSAAYAVITYRSAYLKAHYPVEFMAAVLSSVLGSTDKLVLRIDECRQAGIEVLPPDVNYSGALFRKEGRNKIRFALGAIKGVGSSAAESVEAEAKKKHFTGLYEFCERIDLRMLNRGTIEAMIGAGALDSLPGTRKAKLTALEASISAAQNEIAMRDSGQMGLFGGSDDETVVEQMPNVGEFQEADLLSRENAALGFFLTNHPVKRYKDLQKTYGTCRVRDILVAGGGGGGFGEDSEFTAEEAAGSTPEGVDLHDGDTVVCAVRVSTVTKRMTKDGKRMAVLTIEDDTGTVDGVVFPDAWSRLGQIAADIASDSVLIVVGLADFSREAPQVIIDDLVKPESALSRFTAGVRITLSASEQLANEQVKWLKARTRQEGGSTYLHLNIPMGDHVASIALSQRFSIEWNERTAKEFSGQFGSDAISIIPKRNFVSSSRRRNGFGVRDNSSN